MQATFVNDEVIWTITDGPRSTFSQDEVLDEAEINVSGGPVGQTGRLFDAPDNAPSEAHGLFRRFIGSIVTAASRRASRVLNSSRGCSC